MLLVSPTARSVRSIVSTLLTRMIVSVIRRHGGRLSWKHVLLMLPTRGGFLLASSSLVVAMSQWIDVMIFVHLSLSALSIIGLLLVTLLLISSSVCMRIPLPAIELMLIVLFLIFIIDIIPRSTLGIGTHAYLT